MSDSRLDQARSRNLIALRLEHADMCNIVQEATQKADHERQWITGMDREYAIIDHIARHPKILALGAVREDVLYWVFSHREQIATKK